MTFDVRTAFVVYALFMASFAFAFLIVHRAAGKPPYSRSWLLYGFTLVVLGLTVGFRLDLPEWPGAVVSNACFVAGIYLVLDGVAHYTGRPRYRRWGLWLAVLYAVYTIAGFVFATVDFRLPGQSAIVGTSLVVAALALGGNPLDHDRSPTRQVTVLLLIDAALWFVRAAATIAVPAGLRFESTTIGAVLSAGIAVVTLIVFSSLVGLVQARTYESLVDAQRRIAAMESHTVTGRVLKALTHSVGSPLGNLRVSLSLARSIIERDLERNGERVGRDPDLHDAIETGLAATDRLHAELTQFRALVGTEDEEDHESTLDVVMDMTGQLVAASSELAGKVVVESDDLSVCRVRRGALVSRVLRNIAEQLVELGMLRDGSLTIRAALSGTGEAAKPAAVVVFLGSAVHQTVEPILRGEPRAGRLAELARYFRLRYAIATATDHLGLRLEFRAPERQGTTKEIVLTVPAEPPRAQT